MVQQTPGRSKGPTLPNPSRRRSLLLVTVLTVLAAATPTRSMLSRVIALSLVNGQAHGATLLTSRGRAPVLIVRQDEVVELRWSVDRSMALHLHGYWIEVQAAPGTEAVMSFVARFAGRFPVETHDVQGRHRAVLYVEVHPQ
jgi:hypothetical protein